jgi:1-phosphatidylinositol-3-phosphate 5-kinase
MPCYGPEIRVFEYYRHPSDITLGQYLMSLFADALEPCPSPMCGYPALNHYLSYAHGDARVNVITQQFECPIPGMADKLLMWSYCKECKKATQVARVSENTWNYSFGKFLELFLYQQGVHCRADICPHEMGRHHVRFFGYMDLSVGFQYEPIDLLEVAVPPIKLFMLSQVQIDLKDNEQKLLRTKINKFYQSIIERNKAFPYDLVDPLQLNECKAELEELSDRSLGTKKKVLQILQNIYATTAKSDTLTINWVRRLLCQEMAEWDMEYADLVRRYLLPERELRKITTSQLRRIFPVDSTNAPYDSTTSSGTSGDFMGNERIKRSSETTDLPLLGIALDGDDEETMIGYMLKSTTRRSYALGSPPTILPLLSSSPDDTIRYDNDSDDSNDSDAQESDGSTARRRPSLLRPSIRRRLSRELNRELLLRFRASDTTKDDRSSPTQGIQTKSPGPTPAAMTPSRIPVPNININNTSRPQLSPPIYDTLATGALNAKSATALGGNRMPMAPIKVPSSFELNVSTPKLRALTSKDTPPHRNISGRENRISGQNELRAGIPPSTNESPMFMQELYQQKQQRKQQQYDHYGGLQTQSLQHIPSMFKTQYANNDYGRRALGSIRRRITSPSNNESSNIVIPGGDATIGRLGSQHGPFRSRLPRKKTYIQVYTQANELVKEDMDDEFLVSDLDDLGDIDGNGSDIEETSSNNKNPPRIDKAALSEDTGSKTDGPVDYFSPHAPYSGTSVTSSSKSTMTSGAVVSSSSLTRTPVSTESVPAAVLRSSSSMLERLDTGPSTDSGRSSNLLDNQLPLASDLLLSPAATSTSDTPGNKYEGGLDEQQQQQMGKLPRNALIGRRTIDLEDAKHVEKTSFMKTITSFLTDNGTDNLLPLENPL